MSADEATKLSRLFAAHKNISARLPEDPLKYQLTEKGSAITVNGDFNSIYKVLSSMANGIFPRPEERLISTEELGKIEHEWNSLNRAGLFSSRCRELPDTNPNDAPQVTVGEYNQ